MSGNNSIRQNLNVYETAMEANKCSKEEIEQQTCFDNITYILNDDNVHLWQKKLEDLQFALQSPELNWSTIVPINYLSREMIKRFFELKVQFYQKILQENGYLETE